jgi:curved DNA-binding protein CbpA
MNFSKDYYAILGVTPTAESVVIRAAYKALAQLYHPDKCSDTSEDLHKKMSDLNEAYDLLNDPIKRQQYDKYRYDKDK